MKRHVLTKNTALASAIIAMTINVAVQAKDIVITNNEQVFSAFALGTQSQAAAEAQENAKTDDDLKLSSNLFRLKQYIKHEEAQGRDVTNHRTVGRLPDINIDILINGSVDSAKGELGAAGFNINAVYGQSVGGTLSAEKLEALSQIPAVRQITLPRRGVRAGAVENQADFVQYSKRVKETLKNAPTGKGVTIGILSDSYDCIGERDEPGTVSAAQDVNNGELPADVYVVKEETLCIFSGTDEGRAMAQLVHDIAPDAKIAIYVPENATDFAQGIQTLARPRGQMGPDNREGAGANIIVDDLYYYNEPFYENGIIGDSINSVVNKGVAYFTSAGNNTMTDDEGKANTTMYVTSNAQFLPYTPPENSPTRLNNGQVLKISDRANGTVLPLEMQDTDENRTITVWWNQSYAKGSQSTIRACLTKPDGTAINRKGWCETQQIGQEPSLQLSFNVSDVLDDGNYGLQIFYIDGVKPTSFAVLGNQTVGIDPAVAAGTGSIFGHSATPAAFTVGAANFADMPQCSAESSEIVMESFSSHGNTPLLFDSQGNDIFIVPNKPDATAADGVSTSFFGEEDFLAKTRTFKDPACQMLSKFKFFGTSAAAPNAAAVAALLLQDNPGIAPEALYNVLRQTATPIGEAPTEANYNYVSGYGLVNAEKAINTLRAAQK